MKNAETIVRTLVAHMEEVGSADEKKRWERFEDWIDAVKLNYDYTDGAPDITHDQMTGILYDIDDEKAEAEYHAGGTGGAFN